MIDSSPSVNGVLLPLTALATGALLLLSIVGALFGTKLVRFRNRAGLVCCLVTGAAVLLHLLLGATPIAMSIPLGLAGQSTILALDALSSLFILLLMLVGAASLAETGNDQTNSTETLLLMLLGAMALILLTADAFALVAAVSLMSVVCCCLAPARLLGSLHAGLTAACGVCLIAALALLSGQGAGFEAIRAHPPEGLRAALVLCLVLIGAGGLIWQAAAASSSAASGPTAALMAGGMAQVALYTMIRLLFDLSGSAQPLWWSLPVLAVGTAAAVTGALRATTERDLGTIVTGGVVGNFGMVAIGLGIGLAARAADLPALAGLALSASLLHALFLGLVAGLLHLAAGAIRREVAETRLDLLGGLIRRMPITAGGMLLGAACLAGLPPSAGFASQWLLFQTMLGAVRLGGLGLQILICLAAAGLALATGLAAFAAIRLVGLALLGPPRSRKAAEAVEAAPPTRWAILSLAVPLALLGIFPGLALGLAQPALRLLAGTTSPDALLTLRPAADLPGYTPLGVVLALAFASGAIIAVLRARAVPGYRTGPAWLGGLAPSPVFTPASVDNGFTIPKLSIPALPSGSTLSACAPPSG